MKVQVKKAKIDVKDVKTYEEYYKLLNRYNLV